MENYMKEKANEMINSYKEKCKNAGVPLSERDEQMFRIGMSFGISLASLGLGNLSYDITMESDK